MKEILMVLGTLLALQLHAASIETAIIQTYDREISGLVVGDDSEPLIGATVRITNNIGTVTDLDGTFSLTAPDGENRLTISYTGYLTQDIDITGLDYVEVTLLQGISSLDEIVVVGYGVQKRSDVTGAIGSIRAEELLNTSAASTAAIMQGKVAGVRVDNNGGAPGAGVNVVIRGTGTFGNDQPLYVIDGSIVQSMDFLNPNDIESIEILKDASAAAIYGNRASNGVVLVTTKKGQAGEVQINLDTKWGVQSPTHTFDFLNAREYADFRNIVADNDGDPRAVPNDSGFDPSIDTDWQDLAINPALYQHHNINFSGGSDNATYYISAEYLDQEGIVVDSDFQRYGLRANSTFKKGRFSLTENLSFSRSANNPNTYFGRERGEIPTIPVFNEDNLGGFAGIDPNLHGVARGINWYGTALLVENQFTMDRFLANIQPQFEIMDGLTYKLNLGLDYLIAHNYSFTPKYFLSTSQEASNDISRLTETFSRGISLLVENTLNFNRTFGNHGIDVVAGYTYQRDKARSAGGTGTAFPTNDLRVLSAATDDTDIVGLVQENTLLSVLGRINYVYDRRYMLSATIRNDGSSRFAKDNRWGTFPSVSVGWRISEEPFFPETALTNLKIRASYGILGSQNIGNYDIISGINILNNYNFAGVNSPTSSGSIIRQLANPTLIWETTKTTNVGIDAGFWNDKLTLTLEYFKKRSEDILTRLPIPLHGGLGSSLTSNAATIENQGFELQASYRGASGGGDFTYQIGVNLTTLTNNVVALGENVNPIIGGGISQSGVVATRTDVGQPVGAFFGYVVEGIYNSQAEIDADGRLNAVLGDFNYEDTNGDGQINSEDQVYLGDAIPDLTYGVNFSGAFRGFDFSIFLQGVQGMEIWNGKRFHYILDGTGGNKISEVLNAWTPQNTNTNIPRPTQRDGANNRRASDFFVENGAYLRVKNLQLGFSLPTRIVEKVAMSNARFYISGQNIITLTDYSGYDPEIGRGSVQGDNLFDGGVDRRAYPQAKIWFAGLQVTF